MFIINLWEILIIKTVHVHSNRIIYETCRNQTDKMQKLLSLHQYMVHSYLRR